MSNQGLGSKIEARFDLPIGSLAILEKFLRFNPNQLGNPNHGDWLFNPKHGDEDAKPARESKSQRLLAWNPNL